VLLAFNRISEQPALYPVVHRGTRRALTRRFPFAVYYLWQAEVIIVVAVMHGSRNPRRWKQRT
jgi:plasmid stabilization system protein ParE